MTPYPPIDQFPYDAMQVFYGALTGTLPSRRVGVQACCTLIMYIEGYVDPVTVATAAFTGPMISHADAATAVQGALASRAVDVGTLLKLLPIIIQIHGQISQLFGGHSNGTQPITLPGDPVGVVVPKVSTEFPGQPPVS